MILRPGDLGETWHRHVVAQRTGASENAAEARGLSRLWVNRRGVSSGVARMAVPAASGASLFALPLAAVFGFAAYEVGQGFLSGASLFGVATSAAALAGGYGLSWLPREAARRALESPLNSKEIRKLRKRKDWRHKASNSKSSKKERRNELEWAAWKRLMSDDADDVIEEWMEGLLGGGSDRRSPSSDPISDWLSSLLGVRPEPKPQTKQEVSLEDAFLALVETLLETENVPDEDSVRSTVRAIGDAMGSLPEPRTPDVDPAALLGRARQVLRQAANEPDRVVEASLLRQARALVDQSQSLERSLTVARRTSVLRRELRLQIESLQASLASWARHGGVSPTEAHMAVELSARVVEGIAKEARSVGDAREELADTLDPKWRSMGSTETGQSIRTGRH